MSSLHTKEAEIGLTSVNIRLERLLLSANKIQRIEPTSNSETSPVRNLKHLALSSNGLTDWADLETRLLAFSELGEVDVRVTPAEHTFDAPVADFLDATRAILDIMEKMASLHHGGKLRVGFAPAAWMSNRADVIDVVTNLLRESSGGVLDEVCHRLDVHANWRRLIRSQHDIRATYGLQDSRSQ